MDAKGAIRDRSGSLSEALLNVSRDGWKLTGDIS
jgi:hypothetical protein